MSNKIVPLNVHTETVVDRGMHQNPGTRFQSYELESLRNVTTTGIMNSSMDWDHSKCDGGINHILVQNKSSSTEVETILYEAEYAIPGNLPNVENKTISAVGDDWISSIDKISQSKSDKEWNMELHEQFEGINDSKNWSADINFFNDDDIESAEQQWEGNIPDLKISIEDEWVSDIKLVEITQDQNWKFNLQAVEQNETDNQQGWNCHLPDVSAKESQDPKNWTTELNDVNIIDYIDTNEWKNKLPNVLHTHDTKWNSNIRHVKERSKLDDWKGGVEKDFCTGRDVWTADLKSVKERSKLDDWESKLDNTAYNSENLNAWKFYCTDVKDKERDYDKEWRTNSNLSDFRYRNKDGDWHFSKPKENNVIPHNKPSHWTAEIKNDLNGKDKKDWSVVIKQLKLKEAVESKSWKYNLNDCKLLKDPSMSANIKDDLKSEKCNWKVDSPDFKYSEGGCIIL